MSGACFFASDPNASPCEGHLDRAHIISQQRLKREFPNGAVRIGQGAWNRVVAGICTDELRRQYGAVQVRTLKEILADRANIVVLCRTHHYRLDTSRTLKIPRADLPASVEEFASELQIVHMLDREYGVPDPIEAAQDALQRG